MKKLLLITLIAVFASCSSEDSNNEDSNNDNVSTVAFFKATVDGNAFQYIEEDILFPTHYHSYGNGYNGNGFDKSFYYTGYMLPMSAMADYPSIDLTMHNMFQSTSESDETAAFYSTFDDLPNNFITYDDDSNLIKGISLTLIDEDEKYYSTLAGSQAGSTINYATKINGTDGGLQTVRLIGSVNCKLYNTEDPSDVKIVTNGTFKLFFREYN